MEILYVISEYCSLPHICPNQTQTGKKALLLIILGKNVPWPPASDILISFYTFMNETSANDGDYNI